MRRAVDITVVLAIAAVVMVVLNQRKAEEASVATMADVQASLDRLYERASYYGALHNSIESENTLWPAAIEPAWFDSRLPTNGLLSGVTRPERLADGSVATRPWIDVAPPGDDGVHPPDPVAVRIDQAQFWYNPNVGVFRARVSPKLGYDDALAMYNRLNGLELAELHYDTLPARTPLAYSPGTKPAATLASPPASSLTESVPSVSTRPRPSLFNPDPEPEIEVPHVAPEPPAPEPAKPRGRNRLK